MFILEEDINTRELDEKPTAWLYDDYKQFCIHNNYGPVSKIKFTKTICEKFNVKVTTSRIGSGSDSRSMKVYTV